MSSRLEKRCLATSALVHGTLLALLLFAPGFRKARLLDSAGGPPLELMAGELIDAALAPGFLQSSPSEPPPGQEPDRSPPPKTEAKPEPEPEPVREPEPKPAPPPKAREPEPDLDFDLPKAREPGFTLPSTKAAQAEKPKTPAKQPEKPKPPEKESVKIDLSKIKRITPATPPRKAPPAQGPSAEELARARREQLARSIDGASGRIAGAVSSGTVQIQIGPAGGGGGGAGGTSTRGGSTYAWHVRNAFINAWIPPQNVQDSSATTDVTVVIRRDGRVAQARIVKRSGIAALDRSVQDALDRVREIVPFEPDAQEDQRTYTIGFNLRSKFSF